MDIDPSPDQQELRAEARRFLAEQCPSSVVRGFIEEPGGWSRDLWKQMAGLGWMGIAIGEEHGGLGLGTLELAALVEACGEVLAPVPFLSSTALAARALDLCGTDDQRARELPAVAAGERILGWVWADDAAALDIGETVSGLHDAVPDAPAADAFIVGFEHGLFLVTDGFSVEPVEGFDLTRALGRVRFDGARAERLPGDPARAWANAVAMVCAELVGVAQRAVDLSVAYAKEREQFGRPIGGFQAIKHMLAEMHAEVDAARAATLLALRAVETDDAAATAASVAKSYASDACAHAASEAIQVHGGIGYTWEHDIHLFTRRAKSLQAFMGDAHYHRERIAQHLEL